MRSCRNNQCRIRSHLSYFVLPFVHDVGDCHNHKRHLIIHTCLIRPRSYLSLAFLLFGLFEISLKLTINHIMALVKRPKMVILVSFGNAVSSLTICDFFTSPSALLFLRFESFETHPIDHFAAL